MTSTVVNTFATTLPADDTHPYRTGAWQPNHREWDAFDLEVEGEIPADLEGVYLRNTENPVHESIGMYHPFDGDGMIHMVSFAGGKASYRNRCVRTDGLRPGLSWCPADGCEIGVREPNVVVLGEFEDGSA